MKAGAALVALRERRRPQQEDLPVIGQGKMEEDLCSTVDATAALFGSVEKEDYPIGNWRRSKRVGKNLEDGKLEEDEFGRGWKIVFCCENSGWKKSGKMNFEKVGRLFFAVKTTGGRRVGR